MPVHNADIAAHHQRLRARRGWLQRGNVLNSSDRKTLRTRLNAGRDAAR